MDPSEIDQALDMRLVVSYEGSLPIAEFSRNRNMHFQGGLMLGEKTVEISCFIPDDMEQNREVSIFLAQNKVKRMNKNFILNFSFDDPVIHNALTGVVKRLSSMIIDNLTLKDGVYYLSFRFHSSEMTTISDAIVKYSSSLEKIGIDYLGPNPGIDRIATEAKLFTPLVGVSFEMTPPPEFLNTEQMKALGSEWVSEARYMSNTDTLSHVIKTSGPVKNPEKYGIRTVDEHSNLYESQIDIPLLSHYFQKSYDSRIIRIRRTLDYKDGKFKASIIVPETTSSELLSVLSSTNDALPEWHLTLSEYRRLTE